jgi:ASC-1-like (ASCH) protein
MREGGSLKKDTNLEQVRSGRARVGVKVEQQRRVERNRGVDGGDVVGLGGDNILWETN